MEFTTSAFRISGFRTSTNTKSKTIIKGRPNGQFSEARSPGDFSLKISSSADKLLPKNSTVLIPSDSPNVSSDKNFKILSSFSTSKRENQTRENEPRRPYLSSNNVWLPRNKKGDKTKETQNDDTILNDDDFIPPNLKGDLVYANLKSLGEKKQVSDIERWFDSLQNKMRQTKQLAAEKKKQHERNMYIKGIEALMVFINRDHGEVAKLINKMILELFNEKATQENESEKEAETSILLNSKIKQLEWQLTESKAQIEKFKLDANKMLNDSKKKDSSHPNIDSKKTTATQTDFPTDKTGNIFQAAASTDQLAITESNSNFAGNNRKSRLEFNILILKTEISENFEIKIDDNGISQATVEEAREIASTKKLLNSTAVFFPQEEHLRRKSIEKRRISTINEDLTISRRKRSSTGGMQELSYSDLKQQTEELMTLNSALSIYEKEMKKFYEELDKVTKYLEKTPETSGKIKIETLKHSIQNNQNYNKQFIEHLRLRDTHQQQELMNLKIEIAERGQLQFEQEQINRNWKRRFDYFFQNFQRLKHYVAQDQDERDKLINSLVNFKGMPKEATTLIDNLREFTPASMAKIRGDVRVNSQVKPQATADEKRTKKKKFATISEVIGEFLVKGSLLIEMPFAYLNKKRIIRNVFSNNSIEAQKLIRDVREVPLFPSDHLKLDQIIKLISGVYVLLIKMKRRENENPLYFILYDYLMNTFGGTSLNIEKKFRALIGSCVAIQDDHPKIRMFLKLITVIHHDPYEFDGIDLIFYIESMRKLDEENSKEPGLSLASNTQDKTFIPIKSALEYGTSLIKLSKEMANFIKLDEFHKDLNKIRVPHQTISGSFNVDFDLFMDSLFKMKFKYLNLRFDLLFKAIDVEMQEAVSFEQFLILLNLLEPKKFTLRGSLVLFAKYVDLVDEDAGSNYLSFKAFATCADNEGLFGSEAIENWRISNKEHNIVDFEHLEVDWGLIKNLIRLKLIKARSYSLYFQKMLSSFDYIFPIDTSETDLKMMWMRFKIIDSYSQMLFLDSMVNSCIAEEILEMTNIYKKLEN